MTIQDVLNKKKQQQKIVMLTAYDYPIASLADEAGVDIVLVGDSLANVVLGLSSTKEVGMKEMLHHTKAVVRAVKKAMIVGDMPFEAYQTRPQAAVDNAKQFMDIGCHAIKLEWFDQCPSTVEALVKAGIPVMGHVGLTPQTATDMKVQGRDANAAKRILESARLLQDKGCFSLVLECIPKELAVKITEELKIPTIGIGAGVGCDGQVLVSYDILGIVSRYQPKFSKKYADLAPLIVGAFKQYTEDVQKGNFPDDPHSFHMAPQEIQKL
ncbi:MAG: 3-methyl-2-oxobutanoate hydroxymethyltransferase [Candidatus Omnitrophica bacterium]|nr:3-methyl-2-oxobutanoate hydroxymethyltransferase [Candidatus Omnitrophota bacterium]